MKWDDNTTLEEIYQKGVEDGYDDGYDVGYNDGINSVEEKP